MNEFSDLEAQLQQLRPAAPSPEMMKRVEQALEASSTPTAGVLPKPKTRVNWFALGGRACGGGNVPGPGAYRDDQPAAQQPTVAAFTPAPSAPRAQPAGLVPDGLTRVVYNTRDEGLLFPTEAKQPVRRVRSRTRETLKWRDPGTGASLRVTYPTEEVDLIPVSGQ
jgi:hypothetical protein